MRVLVVDDDVFSGKLVSLYLKQMEAEAEAVTSGPACLAQLESASFDLILMDCQMPEMDGFATVLELRKRGHALPIVALTGDVDEDTVTRCLAVGMNGHLGKPVKPDVLRLALLQHLSDPLERVRALSKATGNQDILKKLTGTFQQTCELVIQQLGQAIDQADVETCLALTHRLKGSSGSFGATYFSQLTEKAEEQLRDAGFEAARERLRAVVAYWPKLKEKLGQS